jgi:hypothetical protein
MEAFPRKLPRSNVIAQPPKALQSPIERRLIDRSRAFLRCGAAILLGLLVGCSSHRPEQMSETAVVILKRTPQEISTATKDTFKRHQFEDASREGELVFQRRGSVMNDVMSPNWFDGPTWVRIRVLGHQLDADRTVLDYRAFLVQQPEDPMFEKEQPYGGHKDEFKSLMLEIAQSLNQSTNMAK